MEEVSSQPSAENIDDELGEDLVEEGRRGLHSKSRVSSWIRQGREVCAVFGSLMRVNVKRPNSRTESRTTDVPIRYGPANSPMGA